MSARIRPKKGPPSVKKSDVKKATQSSIGAPSQRNQGSRKGKKAWRKHVDIDDVEGGLEEIRAEERVTGTALQKQKDSDLFHIDLKGDERIRKSLPRFSKSQLTSTKILAQRSAVPPVFSRTQSSKPVSGKRKLNSEEKDRLARIGKRLRKGPFNSVIEPGDDTVMEVSEAVKQSGGYDPWAEEVMEEVKVVLESVKKAKVKAPAVPHPRAVIELPAVSSPHQGASYNPPVSAHQELLLKAHEAELEKEKEAARLEEVRRKMEQASRTGGGDDAGLAPGMAVDEGREEDGEYEQGGEADGMVVPKKQPARKTRQQRQKAARLLAERRALAQKAARKRQLAALANLKALRATLKNDASAQEKARLQRLEKAVERSRRGLGGQRFGRHKVPEGQVDVQLGEELSESLRGLRPEGNLFRDRFLSLQQRALVEPRVPVLPKRRNKVIAYEKHAYKRFQ